MTDQTLHSRIDGMLFRSVSSWTWRAPSSTFITTRRNTDTSLAQPLGPTRAFIDLFETQSLPQTGRMRLVPQIWLS